ncbi:MAG: NACHT domain-containing protein, partial [Calditrichaeota bacterium]|nr:NACHT domain-containing protein [Calditrichota bacterium]
SKIAVDAIKGTWNEAQSKWKEQDYQKAAKRYANRLIELHGYIHVIGLNKRMRLSSAYTDVNVLSQITSNFHLSKDLAEAIYLNKAKFGDIKEGGERKDGLELIRTHNKHFILGKPGAGKTTFLKYLLQEAVYGRLFNDESKQVIPICIELKKYSESGSSTLEYISEQFDTCRFPNAQPFIESILGDGKAIILFDGLDEVVEQNRHKVIEDITKLSDKYNNCHFAVTCRIAATDYAFQRHGYTYIEMADFSEAQITEFAKNWFRTSGDEIKSNEFLKSFNKPEHIKLRELGKTPLLLAMMCLLYDEHSTFPERHVEVYDQAIDALLYKWWGESGVKHEEIYRNLDLGRKKQMFSRIAAKNFMDERFLFPQEQLQDEIVEYLRKIPPERKNHNINGQTILKAIEMQHGIYVERAKGYYSYSHLSFQEYFTAYYITENAVEGSLSELISNHWQEDRWREIFLRTAEKMANADIFFEVFNNELIRYLSNSDRLKSFLKFIGAFDSIKDYTVDTNLENIFAATSICLTTSLSFEGIIDTVMDLGFDLTFLIKHGHLPSKSLDLERRLFLNRQFVLALSHGIEPEIFYSNPVDLIHRKFYEKDITQTIDVALGTSISIAYLFSTKPSIDYKSNSHILDQLKKHIKHAIDLSKKKELLAFESEMKRLEKAIPSIKASSKDWSSFASALEVAFRSHRPIHEYKFSLEEADSLGTYLKGVKLLLDCLEVAYVDDRKGIKNRLFRVPEEAQEI